jgi:hypothetical protein
MVKNVFKKLKWIKNRHDQNHTMVNKIKLRRKGTKYENWEQKNNQAFNDSYEFARV